MTITITATSPVCALAPPASSDWQALGQLAPDQPVQVRTSDAGSAKGKFVSADAAGISISGKGGVRRFDRTKVTEVRVRTARLAGPRRS